MSRLLHWSPITFYDRSQSLALEVDDGQVFCQAVVQVLIGEPGKGWTSQMVGELVLYSVRAKRPGEISDVYLSFFASDRQRFIIKMSDKADFWHTRHNFVVIRHGQLLGLNFCLEHQDRVAQLVRHMRGPTSVIRTGRILRALQNAVHYLHPPRKAQPRLLDPVRQPRAFLDQVIAADSDDI